MTCSDGDSNTSVVSDSSRWSTTDTRLPACSELFTCSLSLCRVNKRLFWGDCIDLDVRRIVPGRDGVLGAVEESRMCDVLWRVAGEGLLSTADGLGTSLIKTAGFRLTVEVTVVTRFGTTAIEDLRLVGRALGERESSSLVWPSRGTEGAALGGLLSSQGSRLAVDSEVTFFGKA